MISSQPQGLPSDVNRNEDLRGHIISSVVACMALSFTALVMRLISRRIMRLTFVASDYFAIGGLICSWTLSLLVISSVRKGLGLHTEVVPFSNVRQILLFTFIGEMVFGVGFALIKLSIIALYRKLFPTRLVILSTTVLAVVVILWGIAIVLTSIFSCSPIHGFWDLTVPSTCLSTMWFFVGCAIPNIITDVLLFCLPIREVWKLKLDWRSKVAVSGIFSLASFVIIVSGLRIRFVLDMDLADVPWSFVGTHIWTAVEMDVAVICCCAPTVKPVITYFMKSESVKQTRPYIPLQVMDGECDDKLRPPDSIMCKQSHQEP